MTQTSPLLEYYLQLLLPIKTMRNNETLRHLDYKYPNTYIYEYYASNL